MVGSGGAVACADFVDGQGTLDNGLIALGVGGQQYQWQPGEMQSFYDSCPGKLGL